MDVGVAEGTRPAGDGAVRKERLGRGAPFVRTGRSISALGFMFIFIFRLALRARGAVSHSLLI